jgi:hypothetical protein
MGILKNMACRGAYYYICGVRDQRAWSELILDDLGIKSKPFLDDLWAWGIISARIRLKSKRRKILNCWEFMRCGNGGGKCKASTEQKLHGIHEGQNAGRACWAIPRTLCREHNREECLSCEFYHKVHEEQLDYVLEDKALKLILRMKE